MSETSAPVSGQTCTPGNSGAAPAGNLLAHVPAVKASDPLAKYFPEGVDRAQVLYCTLDPQDPDTKYQVSKMLATTLLTGETLIGKTIVITAFLVTEATRTNDDGEVICFPHVRVLEHGQGQVFKFSGVVGLKSLMQIAKDFTPAEWQAGIPVKVHGQKSRHGGTMLLFEVIREGSNPKESGNPKRNAK